jgi:hypothetical protein
LSALVRRRDFDTVGHPPEALLRGDRVNPTTSLRARTVACAARPNTSFVHLDAPCQCFFGGPAPVHATPFDDRPVAVGPPAADGPARAA